MSKLKGLNEYKNGWNTIGVRLRSTTRWFSSTVQRHPFSPWTWNPGLRACSLFGPDYKISPTKPVILILTHSKNLLQSTTSSPTISWRSSGNAKRVPPPPTTLDLCATRCIREISKMLCNKHKLSYFAAMIDFVQSLNLVLEKIRSCTEFFKVR